MDTRFEINIKYIGVKGDNSALYVFLDEKLLLNLEYKDIEVAVKFHIKKINQQQLTSHDRTSLPIIKIKSDDEE